jgi:microcystin-dependent protein
MARREYTSGRPTTLASPFAIGAGTFTIADDGSATTWPTGADHPFWVTIDAGTAQEERVLCSGRSVRVVTVASGGRGQDGTSESNHSAGATVWPSWSATDADESNEHINLTTGVHGYTATAAEINILDGATLSTAELNILDGVTATTAELNYTDGVTSPIQTQLNTNTPVGTIVMYGGTTAPTGWLLCNGQATTGYTNLAAVVGSFVPDLMGRVPMGYGDSADNTDVPSAYGTIGAKFGKEAVVLTEAQLASHNHTQNQHAHAVYDPSHTHAQKVTAPNPGGIGIRTDYTGDDTDAQQYPQGISTDSSFTGISVNGETATNNPAGGGQAHENRQPSTVVNFIIKT